MGSQLEGKVAVVSGAGPGIGRACALRFADSGADVVVAARRPEPLRVLADEVAASTGRRTLATPTDVADLAQCRRLIETTVAEFGRVDVVVNVATYGGGFNTHQSRQFDPSSPVDCLRSTGAGGHGGKGRRSLLGRDGRVAFWG